MLNIFNKILIGSMLSAIIVLENGCTLIGLGYGAVQDAYTPDYDIYSTPEYKMLDSGEEYIFVFQDSDSIIADFIGINKNASDEYIKTTSNFNNIGLPHFGSSLVLRTNAGNELKGKFLGIDDPSILVMLLYDRSHARRVILDSLKTMSDSSGFEFDIQKIKRTISKNEILPFTHLLIDQNGQHQRLSLRKVTEIKQDNSHNLWLYFLLGGLISDIILISSISKMKISYSLK